MLSLLALPLPLLLLALLLVMERVERPLQSEQNTDVLEQYLATARPEEVESFVRDGYADEVARYWARRPRRRAPVPPQQRIADAVRRVEQRASAGHLVAVIRRRERQITATR